MMDEVGTYDRQGRFVARITLAQFAERRSIDDGWVIFGSTPLWVPIDVAIARTSASSPPPQ
jgi:hypothetical protein